MKRIILAIVILMSFLYLGCLANIPKPENAVDNMTYQTDFNKTWSAILTTFHEQNIQTVAIEKESGTISGLCDRKVPPWETLLGIKYRNKLSLLVNKISSTQTQICIKGVVERIEAGEQWTIYRDLKGNSRDREQEMLLYKEIGAHLQ